MSFFTFFFITLIAHIRADCSFTRSFSEEHGGFSEFQSKAIIGIKCHGSYCDDKQLRVCDEYQIDSNTERSTRHSEEQSQYTCPNGEVLAGIKCENSHCDNMYYYCSAPINFSRGEDNEWTNWFSEEEGYMECPAGYVVGGIDCRDRYCDKLKLHCFKVESRGNDPGIDTRGCDSNGNCEGTCVWGAWFSDRRRLIQHAVDYDYAVVGARCRGRYCDDISLLYCDRLTLEGGSEETSTFSEENGGGKNCFNDQPVVSGIKCSHHYCDDKKLKCKRPKSFELTNEKVETLEFSEEGTGGERCPPGFVMTGMRCKGSNCDRIKLRCTGYNKLDQTYGIVNGGLWKFVKVIDPWETATQEYSATFTNEKGVSIETSEMIKFEYTFGRSRSFSICGGASGKDGGGPSGEMCMESEWHEETTTGWEKTLTESVEERVSFESTYICSAEFSCPAPTHVNPGELPGVISTQSKCHLYQWVTYTRDYATGEVQVLETCNYDLIENPRNKPRCVLGQCKDDTDCQQCLSGPRIPRRYFKNQDHALCAGHENDYVFEDKPRWITDWDILDGFGFHTCDNLSLELCEKLCDELVGCVHVSWSTECCFPFKTPINNCVSNDVESPYAEYILEGYTELSVGEKIGENVITFPEKNNSTDFHFHWLYYGIIIVLCFIGLYFIYELKCKKSSLDEYDMLLPEEI